MEKITTNIARITPPAGVSLASNPNFVEFEGMSVTNSKVKPVDITLSVIGNGWVYDPNFRSIADFRVIEEKTKIEHLYRGVAGISKGQDTFVIYPYTTGVSDIVKCLKVTDFFKDRFFIIQKDNSIHIQSKGYGDEYSFSIKPVYPEFSNFMTITDNLEGKLETEYLNKIDAYFKIEKGSYLDDQKIRIRTNNPFSEREFIATTDKTKVNNNVFFFNKDDIRTTIENFRMCLMEDDFFGANYQISTDLQGLRLLSKGVGDEYSFSIEEIPYFISVEKRVFLSMNRDTITSNFGNTEIHLDIYNNTGTFPGVEGGSNMGEYITTLSKSYFGKPLWFDVNSLWHNENRYSSDFLLSDGEWKDAGTCSDFRIVAKRFNGYNNEPFYYSDVLYTLTGYDRNLAANTLADYVYDTKLANVVKPLTRQPVLTHIKGQKQYFNFFLSDPLRSPSQESYKLGILYKVYSQSGGYLGTQLAHEQDIKSFHAVNTICLHIDKLVADYPKAGIIKAHLCREGKEVSQPLVFNILPNCLYKVHDFAFLNSLGGWSSFNFGGVEQVDFKADAVTFYQTQTPAYDSSGRIESVFNKEVSEQFVVQTLPVTAEVADWLKELSASIAVYELSTARYVIVDELNVKHSSKDDLFTLQMKYHYSDAYNASIKR